MPVPRVRQWKFSAPAPPPHPASRDLFASTIEPVRHVGRLNNQPVRFLHTGRVLALTMQCNTLSCAASAIRTWVSWTCPQGPLVARDVDSVSVINLDTIAGALRCSTEPTAHVNCCLMMTTTSGASKALRLWRQVIVR